jgi:methenyltetrahydromethanopterin cyclohydrolase
VAPYVTLKGKRFEDSINRMAFEVVKEMIAKADELNIGVGRANCGATIIDCGVNVEGSIDAGLYLARVTSGDLIRFSLAVANYDGVFLPTLYCYSDYPVIATMGAQLGDWEVRYGNYFAIGSGPARALALDREMPRSVAARRDKLLKEGLVTYTPREIFEKIGYRDKFERAVIVLESENYPPDEALRLVADMCHVKPEDLYVLVAPTSTLAGSIQIAGRIIEVGIYKLALLGFDFTCIRFGFGVAPIAPPNPDAATAMGRVNDAIRYCGSTYYIVDFYDDEQLRDFVKRVPPTDNEFFTEIFKKAQDFYDVDPRAFAPAAITVTNVKTGKTFSAGRLNADMLRKSLEIR